MGTEYTPTHNIAHPDGQYAVDPESYLTALAQSVDSGLTDAIGTAAALASAPTYASGTNLDDITVGSIGNATASLVANTPSGATNGIVHTWVHPANPESSRLQVYWELGVEGRVWTRFRGSTSWTDWRRIDAEAAASRAASPRLANGTNLDDITTGQINAALPAVDALLNAPTEVGGILYTYVNAVNSRLQMYYELGLSSRIWRRFRGSTAWTAWARVDAAYAIEQMSEMIGDGGGGGSPSALKTLPVVLSASTGAAPATVATGGVRFPLNVNAPITRWRLCIRNHNYRTDVTSPGGASFTGLWVGPRSGQTAAFATTPTQISGPFTLPPDGAEYATPWSNAPIGDGAEMLLSLGWTGAGEATTSPSGCYRTTSSTTGGATSGAGYSVNNTVPFSWWVEVETAATTPVVAIWGDSISCGTGNTFVIHDSPLSQYCRRIGALPFHAGYPGTAMNQWEPAGNNYAAWSRFSHLARPDAVIHFMGQNDLITADQTEMRRRFEATLPLVREHLSQNVYVATITPHAGKTEAQNTIRKNYNTWLRTLPLGVRDVFEFGPAVANATNDALLPVYDSGDGLHLSTAGSTALAQAVTRPVTTQRTDRDTDRDTGRHNVVPMFDPAPSSGTAVLQRIGNVCLLNVYGLTFPTPGSGTVAVFPNGYRPDETVAGTMEGLSGRMQVTRWGNLQLYSWGAAAVTGSLMWLTRDPWPTTLPGTPA